MNSDPFIYRVETLYLQRTDRRYAIQQYIVVSGEPPEGFSRFTAEIQAAFARAKNGQPLTASRTFPLEGDTPAEALAYFETNFDTLKKATALQGKNDFLQQQLLVNSRNASAELGRKIV